jgi:hypothetical protein
VLSAQIETPAAGEVIRYRFLWANEAKAGYDAKVPRPCLILKATKIGERYEVLVVPITNEPQHDSKWVKIPDALKEMAGLDERDGFLVYSEANVFMWPSWDVIPVKSRDLSTVIRGNVPQGFLVGVTRMFEAELASGNVVVVDREKIAQDVVADYRRRREERAQGR